MSDREKDVETLVLRHQIAVLERQLGGEKVTFTPEDCAFLAALLVPLPREFLRRLRLLVRPDTVLRWHRDLIRRGHARSCRPKRPGCALREFEQHHNAHRPHQAMNQAAPLRAVPEPLEPGQVIHLDIRRRDRLGGVIHEYRHAA